MSEPLPADLVLEGGGVKGIALGGAVTELLPGRRYPRRAAPARRPARCRTRGTRM